MGRWPATPDSGVDTRATVLVEVEDSWRVTDTAIHETASTYDFTATAACEIARILVAGLDGGAVGFHTPASLFHGRPVLRELFEPASRPAARSSHRRGKSGGAR